MSMAEPPPHTNVVALLVHPDGRYLLHLRDANKPISSAGQWSLPGGHPEPGESLDAAIARELLEEADLSIADLAPFALVEDTEPDGRLTGRVQVYAGTWRGDPASVPLTEGIMLRWTDPDSSLADDRSDDQRSHRPPPQRAQRRAALWCPASRPAGPCPGGQDRGQRRRRAPVRGARRPRPARTAPPRLPVRSVAPPLPGRHCEQESAIACLVREAREEAGLDIAADDVEFVHAVHVLDAPGTQPRMQLVFRARAWSGEPRVMEPDKCVSWDWWPIDALPDPTVAYTRAAIESVRRGRLYTEMGWV